MTAIAVCMIVKNEEGILTRCLESVNGLWDELVIVDTGSTDRTVEIAESYGARILHYEWQSPGNKGEARNVGINEAVSQWIVVIDADEVLLDATGARDIILGSQAAALSVNFRNIANEQVTLAWQQIRIFRRGLYAYKYREHEIPVAIEPGVQVEAANIIIEHRVPPGREAAKSAPMMQRLELDVQENATDPHPLYFLHRECLNQGQNERAIKLGFEYLELTKNGGFIQAEIHSNLAVAYNHLRNFDKARKQAHLAVACEPNRREWLYRLAILYYEHGQWNCAVAMCRAALELLPNEDRQWEPQTTARLYDLLNICQREMIHQMAHSHSR